MENEEESGENGERQMREENRSVHDVREENGNVQSSIQEQPPTRSNEEGRSARQLWSLTVNFLADKSSIISLLFLLVSLIQSYLQIKKLREEFFEIFSDKLNQQQ
ncbi:uncharacterized protein VICG_00845 [Vittaforma corneae ATCC 50505]|uniref:Uncharacterized protein n=1 Tax=Vittaforma corneae (strain ATCC 50505) TaxID=993615 RepID=L2GPH3_VITCO|nr:uncharacterized protein VICG_00845 [Vittaforma corneae ATCC 50505]ELA42202.1 hypothetical protein VICG_00845 [Vittaforma corneae ATCC 50505]